MMRVYYECCLGFELDVSVWLHTIAFVDESFGEDGTRWIEK